MQLWKARKVAEEIVLLLSPYCHEIIICGSVRRGKTEGIKDIDLVLRPIIESQVLQPSLLPGFSAGSIEINNHLTAFLSSRSQVDVGIEVVSVGKVHHKLRHASLDVLIELYCITDVSQRGVAVVLRTGPAEFSARLAAFPLMLHWHITGQQVHMHEKGGRVGARVECEKGSSCPLIVSTLDEADVFKALGLPFIEPELRTAKLLQQHERKRLQVREGSTWP